MVMMKKKMMTSIKKQTLGELWTASPGTSGLKRLFKLFPTPAWASKKDWSEQARENGRRSWQKSCEDIHKLHSDHSSSRGQISSTGTDKC